MSAVNEISILLLKTAINFALIAFMLRLLLQLVRADFYNPISQFLVKVTNPVVLPLRKVLPPLWKIDSASLLAAVLVQAIGIGLLLKLYTGSLINPAQLFLWTGIGLCSALVNFYFFAIIANIVLSWVAQGSYHPAAQLLHQLTEPVMAPIRKIVPAMGGLDFSPIIVFLLINVIEVVLRNMAASVGLHPVLVMGL
ncbi:MAG: YggT family protein [Spongiibacteraceae bacterium]